MRQALEATKKLPMIIAISVLALVSVSADMKILISAFIGIGRYENFDIGISSVFHLSAFIGICRYEKKVIGRPLKFVLF